MITKDHNPNINEPIRVAGVDFSDLMIFTIILFGYMLVLGILDVVFDFSSMWLYILGIVAFPSSLAFLKYANKQGEKDFLDSFLAYHFYQPKHIIPYNPNALQFDASAKEVY